MPNNNNRNNQNQSRVSSGLSLIAAAVGVVATLAAAEHAQAREENRESVAEGIGRWIRDNIMEGRSPSASYGAPSSAGRVLSQAEINILPVRCLSNQDIDTSRSSGGADENEKAVCVVCREPHDVGDRLMRLPCFHEFHVECIQDYLATTEGPLCPICRHPVSIS